MIEGRAPMMKFAESQGLAGTFKGTLAATAANKEPWDIETHVELATEGERQLAIYTLTISSETKGRFSNSHGEGELRSFSQPENIRGFLIEMSPDVFLQTLHVPSADALVGNVYSIDSNRKTVFHGSVILHRM